MKLCLKRKTERIITFALVFVGVCLVILSIRSFDFTKTASERVLWEQSTERKLEDQNKNYYNSLYGRYERIERDLGTYQSGVSDRVKSLSDRIDDLEETVGDLENRVGKLKDNQDGE